MGSGDSVKSVIIWNNGYYYFYGLSYLELRKYLGIFINTEEEASLSIMVAPFLLPMIHSLPPFLL